MKIFEIIFTLIAAILAAIVAYKWKEIDWIGRYAQLTKRKVCELN